MRRFAEDVVESGLGCLVLVVGLSVVNCRAPQRPVTQPAIHEVRLGSTAGFAMRQSTPLRMDSDADGDIDLEDYAQMVERFTGPG